MTPTCVVHACGRKNLLKPVLSDPDVDVLFRASDRVRADLEIYVMLATKRQRHKFPTCSNTHARKQRQVCDRCFSEVTKQYVALCEGHFPKDVSCKFMVSCPTKLSTLNITNKKFEKAHPQAPPGRGIYCYVSSSQEK